MNRLSAQKRFGGKPLNDLAVMHHKEMGSDFCGQEKVVGDKKHRHLFLADKPAQKGNDFGLCQGIKGARRLITEKKRGRKRQRARDHHPLKFAARKLIREAVEKTPVQTDA